jgi:hypothetical protein
MDLGRDDAARAEAAEVVTLNPQFSPKMFFRTVGRRDNAVAAEARWSADLRKAGLPQLSFFESNQASRASFVTTVPGYGRS